MTQSDRSQEIHPLAPAVGGDGGPPPLVDRSERKIMVRMPQRLHEALKDQAHTERTSMNRLAVRILATYVATAIDERRVADTTW